MNKEQLITLCLAIVFASTTLRGAPPDVSYQQKLGQKIDLQAEFLNAYQEPVRLKDLADGKPLLIGIGYNACPMLCGEQLQGMLRALTIMDAQVGREFHLFFISIDPDEAPGITAEAQANFRDSLDRGDPKGAHFLRSSEGSAEQLAEALGFEYAWVENSQQFAHPAGWVVVTPEGEVSAYQLGVRYDAKILDADIDRASREAIASERPSLLLRCLQYDPMTGQYGSAIQGSLRIGAMLTLGLLGLFAYRAERRKRKETPH